MPLTLAYRKKIPRIKFQYSISFTPAKYEYESHLFPSRPDFSIFFNKGLKINKIGWSIFYPHVQCKL